MITIEVNGKPIKAEKGENLLHVLRENQIHVPALCHMSNLFPTGACRLCVVEIDGMRGLTPSCSFILERPIKVKTHSPRVRKARQTIVELLLADHPDDCLYCDRNNNCELQYLAVELGIRERRFKGRKNDHPMDVSNASIVRDPAKCILCGRCVRVCEEIQGVSAIDFMGRGCGTRIGTAFDKGLNLSTCINCGQCIMVCPTGALSEQSHIEKVTKALHDPEVTVVVQHAPSVSVTVGEDFGIQEGEDVIGLMTAALKEIGFDKVFDTALSADLTIMEEASEFVERLTRGGTLPMFTSCSPGWIKFVEQFYPEFIPNLSSCKSPQQMMGAIIKSYYAEKANLDPKKIFSVSIMPCTAKKFEAGRNGMGDTGKPDVDAVLTTRELVKLIKQFGIDIKTLPPRANDNPLAEHSSAGKIFGATGGVMEAAVRTAYNMVTGNDMPKLEVKTVRNLDGIKEAAVDMGGTTVNVAVASGLGNAGKLLDEIKNGRNDIHFLEVMTCPGGCIAGGGQPIGTDLNKVKARMETLYRLDKNAKLRVSYRNESVQKLYREFLEKPLSHKTHELLHTRYKVRDDVI